MSGRAKSQANVQRRALSRLREARQRRPGPNPGALPGEEFPVLAVLEAVEHACNVARLARASADPAVDGKWRRIVVVVNAIAQALVDDVKAGDETATTRIYLAVTAMQQHKEKPAP